MKWSKTSITEGEIDALFQAAKRAWGTDTKYPISSMKSSDGGQCYVTACWLQERLGGKLGKRRGHYAWLSPDERYIIDIASHTGKPLYVKNEGFCSVPVIPNDRTLKFAKRANAIFEGLDHFLHLSLDYMGDALPAQEPDRENEIDQGHEQYLHDEPNWKPAEGDYKFVHAGGQLELSPIHTHEELLDHLGVDKNGYGPMAMGHVMLNGNKAIWEVDSNMDLGALAKIFKQHNKHLGWDWGGMTNKNGDPIADEFDPKASHVLSFLYDSQDNHLWLGQEPIGGIAVRLAKRTSFDSQRLTKCASGILRIKGRSCVLGDTWHSSPELIRSLSEYCKDYGLILYAENDNQMKVIPDMEEHNFYDPNPKNLDEHQYPAGPKDERDPAGIYKCPNCNRLFPDYHLYQEHRRDEANDEPDQDGHFPEIEESSIQDSHFTPQQPEAMFPLGHVIVSTHKSEAERISSTDGDQHFVAYQNGSPVAFASLKDGKLIHSYSLVGDLISQEICAKIMRYTYKEPKDLLAASVPFIFDINEDRIILGQPGQRTSEIPGTNFTPGGIIEGMYEPGGKLVLKTATNIPFSVHHLVQLWYYSAPHLSVTNVYMQEDDGKMKKIANDIGGYLLALVASNEAVESAQLALRKKGGSVYVVGGAVRDALLGREPKDIDLMVSKLTPEQVEAALGTLPGQVFATGKDFGVFRYRVAGTDVEIALPRKEYSTGAGHRDFAIHADPNLPIGDDLYRRDFSINAMAVDLSNGQLIDPYQGAADLENGILRSHNPTSLNEDPLRVVRALVANSRFGLEPDVATKKKMAENATSLNALAPERIQAELDKLFAGHNPARAIRLAHETSVLSHILPEVEDTMGYDQNNQHHELELGEHILSVLERVCEKTDDPDVRLAALLHDIGKPGSAWVDPETGHNHFYKKKLDNGTVVGAHHEELGAQMTNALMNRLRYPSDRVKRVSSLVLNHMWAPFTSQRGARRFIHRVGSHVDDLIDIRWADQGGKSAYPNPTGIAQGFDLDKQRDLVAQVRELDEPTNVTMLAINGYDLLEAGITKGPRIGRVLEDLTDKVVDDPSLNERETLLDLAMNVS